MRYTYGLAPDWQITKVLGGLRQPRTIVFDTNGNMLILQATTGVSVHTFAANGCINSSTTIVNNRGLNHGLSLTPDGKTLYASSTTTAWAWDYDVATMNVSNQRVVVKGMSQGIHSTRTLAVVPQAPNLVLLQVGSNSNWDYQSESPSAGRAIVKVFDMSKVPSGGYDYNTQGQVLGYGMRNEIGLTFDPAGHVWGVENSGDVSDEGFSLHRRRGIDWFEGVFAQRTRGSTQLTCASTTGLPADSRRRVGGCPH